MDLLVIRDVDAEFGMSVVAAVRIDPELVRLADELLRHRERGQDQDGLPGLADYVLGPGQLHRGLSEPAVCERCRLALYEIPIEKRLLEVEQE